MVSEKTRITESGTFIRVKVYKGNLNPTKMSYENVEDEGHTQKLIAYHPKKGNFTYGWIFKKLDIKNRRSKTMRILRSIGVKEIELKRMNL